MKTEQIDALITTVGIDASGFYDGVKNVIAGLDTLEARLNDLTTRISAGFKGGGGPLGDAKQAIGDLADTFNRLGPAALIIPDLTKGLDGLIKKLPEIEPASRVFGRIGNFLEGIDLVSSSASLKFRNVLRQLTTFAEDFGALAPKLNTPEIAGAAKSLGQIGNFLRSLDSFKVTDGFQGKIGAINSRLQELFSGLSNVAGLPGMDKIGATLGSLSRWMTAIGKADPAAFQRMIEPVKQFFTELATIPISQTSTAATAISSINRLNSALRRLSQVQPAGILAAANATRQAMAVLSAIPITSNLTGVASVLNQVGGAMRRMSVAGGAGGPPTIHGPLVASLNKVPPAARQANTSVYDMGRSFRDSSVSANYLSGSITMISLSLLGMSALAIKAAAPLDDALQRVVGHLKIADRFAGGDKEALQASAFGVSGKSITNATDLAKGLDILVSSGMSAGMAAMALSRAEDFAVASGMKMEESTRKLVDILHMTDLAVEDVTDHLENMKYVSDLIVGTASRVGSTEKQLADAFTGRFGIAMKVANMDITEGIALLGVYSRMGNSFRGTAGGNIAARTIYDIQQKAVQNRGQWQQMLGVDVIDSAGEKLLNFTDTIDLLSHKLAIVGDPARVAQMGLLGFQERDLGRINALLGQADNLRKLRDELAGTTGATKTLADEVRMGLGSQLQMLWNNAVNVAAVIGTRLGPVLFVLTDAVRRAAEWFIMLDPAIQRLISIGLVGAAAIMPAVWAVRWLSGSLISLAVAPFRLIVAGFNAVWTAASYVASGIMSVFSTIASVPGTVISAITGVVSYVMKTWDWITEALTNIASFFVGVFKTAVSAVSGLLYGVAVTVYALATQMSLITGTVSHVASQAVKGLATIAMTALVSVAQFVGGIIISLAALMIMLPVIVSLFAGLASVVVTVGLGIWQAFTLIPRLVSGMWDGFKSGASRAFSWVADRATDTAASMTKIWNDAKKGSVEFFNFIGAGIVKVAGFFWNFGENIKVVSDWFSENWREALEDIGTVAASILETIGSNLWRVVMAMANVVKQVLFGVWTSVGSYAGTAFLWISDQWANMVSDMWTVVLTFVQNLAKNWAVLSDLFNKLAKVSSAEWLEPVTGIKLNYEVIRKQAIEEASSKLTNPLAGLDSSKLKTDFSSLGDTFGATTGIQGKVWAGVGRRIAAGFSEAFASMDPIASAFDAILGSQKWDELFAALNLKGPTAGAAKAWFDKIMAPFTGEDHEGLAGMPIGKGGPGFQFKQISMERTMVGGPVNEGLDYQQLIALQAIRKDVGIMATARHNDMKPVPAVKLEP